MNFKIEKKKFIKHLNNVSAAISSSTFLKSLQGVKIIVTESNIKLIASNGTLSIREVIEADGNVEIINPGTVLIPGKLFINIIKQQKDTVSILIDNDSLEISSTGFNTNINLLNQGDYPRLSFDGYGDEFEVESDSFRKLIDNVSYASADQDSNRLMLTGVNLKGYEGNLVASSTNSFRLASDSIKINTDLDFNVTIISTNLKHFLPISSTGKISITVDEQKIITKFKTTTIITNLIEGSYPRVDKLIPTQFQSVLTIGVKELNSLIDKAIVVSDENQKAIRLSISEEVLKIESRRKEVGDSVVIGQSYTLSGPAIKIVFNAQYLKQALSKLKGNVQLKFIQNDKPFVVATTENESFLQMVLPHRSY